MLYQAYYILYIIYDGPDLDEQGEAPKACNLAHRIAEGSLGNKLKITNPRFLYILVNLKLRALRAFCVEHVARSSLDKQLQTFYTTSF